MALSHGYQIKGYIFSLDRLPSFTQKRVLHHKTSGNRHEAGRKCG